MRKFKQIVWKILNLLGIGGLVQLFLKSSLNEDGWFLSYHKKQSIDKNYNPLPWFTYPSIEFIKERLKINFIVYEYGCGNSTLWFANYVAKIVSIEHDRLWYNRIIQKLPTNVDIYCASIDTNEYENHILSTPFLYDIIIIDGRKRILATKNALKKLNPKGIIIFDNSERTEYTEALQIIKDSGFKRIDFWGMGPIIHMKTCTTIFYRTNNCFDI